MAKTTAASLDSIASPEALLAAWRKYRSGKRRRPAVAHFEVDAERRLLGLSSAVLSSRFRHAPYRLLHIWDPKSRLIAVASVGDRVLHRSVYDVLAPDFERSYIHDTYACLKHRGSHRAVLRFLGWQRKHAWMLHIDIERYFPSVDHEILRRILSRRIRRRDVMTLLMTILDSGAELYRRREVMDFYGLDPSVMASRPTGLPIGNLTSQWWGNLYLDGFDQFAKRDLKAHAYLRYLDDAVFFADDRATLVRFRRCARQWLAENRLLRLNPCKGHIRPCSLPQSYLGYRVSRRGIDLGPKAIRRLRKRLPGLARCEPWKLPQVLASWRGAMSF